MIIGAPSCSCLPAGDQRRRPGRRCGRVRGAAVFREIPGSWRYTTRPEYGRSSTSSPATRCASWRRRLLAVARRSPLGFGLGVGPLAGHPRRRDRDGHADGGVPGQLRRRMGQRQEAGRGRPVRRRVVVSRPARRHHRRHRRRPVQGHRRPGHQPADQGHEPGLGARRTGHRGHVGGRRRRRTPLQPRDRGGAGHRRGGVVLQAAPSRARLGRHGRQASRLRRSPPSAERRARGRQVVPLARGSCLP